MRLADAHIHLFQRGYHRPGQPPLFGDGELPAYEALRLAHGVEMALAIGYEADGVDPGNNAYLRDLSRSRSWLWTLAFAEAAAPLEPAAIEAFLEDGHAGLAIYALDRACAESLLRWPRRCWELLQSRKAIVSFNSRPEAIAVLGPLTAEWAGVPFLFSHLGLPGAIGTDTPPEALRDRLRPLLGLARLPNVHVKISGVYATSQPQHAYPHSGAYGAIQRILEAFGPARCLWASDFAPALEFVSFPQIIEWPGCSRLSESEQRMVYHDNLARLLSSCRPRSPARPDLISGKA
ncbi:MAG: amidohydrolase family protein [Roseiarcus sp.]